jgi:hypothetical protein
MKKSPDYSEEERPIDRRGPSVLPPLGFDEDPADVYAVKIRELIEGDVTLESVTASLD